MQYYSHPILLQISNSIFTFILPSPTEKRTKMFFYWILKSLKQYCLIKQKCVTKINLLKKLAHTKFSRSSSTLLKLLKFFRTIIRPLLDYGSPIYNFTKQQHLNALNIIHNTSLRIALRAFRTTLIPNLLCKAMEPPLFTQNNSKYIG